MFTRKKKKFEEQTFSSDSLVMDRVNCEFCSANVMNENSSQKKGVLCMVNVQPV